MAARLVGYTAVRDADGITHSFGPGDDVPEWAARRITNPKLWEDGEPPYPAEISLTEEPTEPSTVDELKRAIADRDAAIQQFQARIRHLVLEAQARETNGDGTQGSGSGGTPARPTAPPKGGRGSSEDKWREYAAAVNVDVTAAQDRDAVIALLELAEVPTE